MTGGAGFIGSHIVDALVADGHQVAVVDDLSAGRRENLNPGARLYRCNITDLDALMNVFKKEEPELVNHHAAQTSVRRSMADPTFDASVNVVGSINVLQACVEQDVKRVVFASTCAVYPEPEDAPMDESCEVRPQSVYGMSKLAVEGYLKLFGQVRDLRYKVLRYGNVFGPRQDPAGEAGVVAIFTEQLSSGVKPTIFGDGSKTRDYVYVSDVVSANMACMDETGDYEVFNVARGVETTDREIFEAVRDALGSEIEPDYAPKRAGEAERAWLDCSKARRALSWESRVSLGDGVKSVAASFPEVRHDGAPHRGVGAGREG